MGVIVDEIIQFHEEDVTETFLFHKLIQNEKPFKRINHEFASSPQATNIGELVEVVFYHNPKSLILDEFIGHNRNPIGILQNRHMGAREVTHNKIERPVEKEPSLPHRINAIGG